MRMFFLKLLTILSLLLMIQADYADILETQLSRDKITYGETFTLSLTLNNHAAQTSPDFSVLQKDFRILDTNYGSAVNMVNGVTTVRTFWRLTLEPKKTGLLIIPE